MSKIEKNQRKGRKLLVVGVASLVGTSLIYVNCGYYGTVGNLKLPDCDAGSQSDYCRQSDGGTDGGSDGGH